MLNMPIATFGSKREKPDANNLLDDYVLSDMVRLLLMDIFPKQFGRPNVLDGNQKSSIRTSKWKHSGQWKVDRFIKWFIVLYYQSIDRFFRQIGDSSQYLLDSIKSRITLRQYVSGIPIASITVFLIAFVL
jgi:hypothetical protein